MFRIKRVKIYIKAILKYLGIYDRSIWPKITEKQKKYLAQNIKIKSSIETLDDIQIAIENKQKGAYMRFGDGDIYLMLGKDDMLNKANKILATEMKEAFQLNIGNLHKGLPIHSQLFGFEEGMKINMHLVSDYKALQFVGATYKYLDITKIYSPVALHYVATFHPNKCIQFLKFIKSTNPIFVGNQNIKPNLINKLFSDVHIKTPSVNSYQEIDRIEEELVTFLNKTKSQFQVVIIAMGCPGRVLQKRILKKGFNVYLFDFGSLLDAFNNDNTRLWIDLAGGVENMQRILEKID